MTFRKQMVILVVLIILVSILSNSIISSRGIDRYFNDYVQDQYEKDLEHLSEYAKRLLSGEIESLSQARIELSKYLSDMIVGISIYNSKDELVLSVGNRAIRGHSPMGANSGFRNMAEEIEYSLGDQRDTGTLEIYRLETTTSSQTVGLFQDYLLRTVTLSGILTLIIALLLLAFISKKMTKDLKATADLAQVVDSDTPHDLTVSRITEIQAIQRALVDLGAKLKVKEGIRREKADRIAHEARTPLTLLKSHMEGVKDGVVTFDEKRLDLWLGEIENLSVLLSDLGQILDHQESPAVDRGDFDLKQTVKKVADAMRMAFRERDMTLNLVLPKEDFIYPQGKQLISRNLYNLLTNALKYAPRGARVEVVLSRETAGKTTITVKDSGKSLTPEALNALLTPYSRGSNAQGSKGKGMGLNIVLKNTRALGGDLSIFLTEEGMTAFRIILP